MQQLLIDTTSNKQIRVGLSTDGKEIVKKQEINLRGGVQVILPLIDQLLKEQKVSLKGLSSIIVNIEKGSFTGLRVGMAIANALSFALKIPVFQKEFRDDILRE